MHSEGAKTGTDEGGLSGPFRDSRYAGELDGANGVEGELDGASGDEGNSGDNGELDGTISDKGELGSRLSSEK